MAISDKITSIQDHLKDDWDSVESLIGDTELDKNIENISSALDDLYNDLPKVTGSGTSITLDDTKKGRLESTLSGNTSQTQYTGKNLLPPTIATETKNGITLTNNGDGSYTLTGTYSTSTTFDMALPATLNGTYSFSGNNPTADKNIQFRISASSGSSLSTYLNKVNSISENKTIENGTKQSIRIVGSFTSGFTFKPQLESGSTATSYEPYVGGVATPNPTNPADVNVVSGDNEIEICGKNLLDTTKTAQTYAGVTYKPNADGSITITGTSTAGGTVLIVNQTNPPILEAGTYTRSVKTVGSVVKNSNYVLLMGRNNNGTNVLGDMQINENSTTTKTTTTTDTNTMSQIGIYVSGAGAEFNCTLYIQLEKNSTATDYIPYDGDTYNIDLPMGINLYDFMNNTYNNEGNLTITKLSNGFTFTNNSSNLARIIFSNATVDSSKNYVISFEINNPSGKLARLGWSGSSKTVETRATSGKITGVLTGITTSSFSIYIDGKSTITITNLMYYEGTNTSKSYEPYGTTPIELCKIGNYQDYFGKSDGRNLFDKNTCLFTNGKRYNDSGSIVNDSDSSYSSLISVQPSTTYTISNLNGITGKTVRTALFDSNQIFIERTPSQSTNNITITTTNTTRYLSIQGRNTSDFDINSIQLEKGSSASEWQPYGVGKWYLHKEIGKVVLNGSENWGAFASVNYEYQLALFQGLSSDTPNQYFPALCNRYINHNTAGTNLLNYEFSHFSADAGYGKYRFIRIRNNEVTTLESWKAGLQNNNLILYVPLATPTSTEITDTTLINQLEELYIAKSKENQTNISQINNDLGFIISASALKKGDTIENNSASLLMSFGGLPNTNGEEETPDFEEDVSDVEEETPIEESIEEEIDEEPIEEIETQEEEE